MRVRLSPSVPFLAIVCLLCASAASAGISPVLLMPELPSGFSVGYRFQHPNFSADFDTGLLMGMHEFSFATETADGRFVRVVVPLVKYSIDDYPLPEETAFGNMTLGMQSHAGREGRLVWGIDVELPTAQEKGYTLLATGLYSHPASLTTFVPDLVTFRPYLQGRSATGEDGAFRYRIGPSFLVPVGDGDDEVEVLMEYGLGLSVDKDRFGLSVEFGGYWFMTESMGGFSEESSHVLAAAVGWQGDVLQPALYYEIPTDEQFDDVLDGVFGLRLTLRP